MDNEFVLGQYYAVDGLYSLVTSSSGSKRLSSSLKRDTRCILPTEKLELIGFVGDRMWMKASDGVTFVALRRQLRAAPAEGLLMDDATARYKAAYIRWEDASRRVTEQINALINMLEGKMSDRQMEPDTTGEG